MYDFTIPKVGMGITEVEISEWKVKAGDKVNIGDEIVEIETEKASTVLESNVSGVIKEILCKDGDTVEVGKVVCRIKGD